MSGYKVDAKVVLLGKEYGGKTSLVERFLHNRFSGDLPYQNTIGAAYGAKRVEAFGRQVVLGIWDTAGSERYQAMSRIYYRNTWAAILCYDLTERESYEKVRFWAAELRQHEPNAHIYFVGTKNDLLELNSEARAITYYNVDQLSQSYNGSAVFECSSKTGENVVAIFERIAKDFVKESRDKPTQRQDSNLELEDNRFNTSSFYMSNLVDASTLDDMHLVTEVDGVESEPEVKVESEPVGSSWWASSFIVINAALGAGILNFPAAFDKAGGIFAATVIHVVLVLFALLSFYALGWCSDIKSTSTYQQTIGAWCGRKFGRLCAGIIAIYCYGTCITYLVIVGDQTDRVFFDNIGPDFCQKWYLDRRFMVSILSIVLMLPFCYSKNIDFLKHISGAAFIAILYIIMISIYGYFITDTIDVHVKTKPEVWTDVLTVIPVIMFGYQCHLSVIPIYYRIQPHNLVNYSKTVSIAAATCFISYTLVGIFGYLTFGTDVKPDLLSCYSTKNVWFAIGYFIFGIKNFLAYPIILFVGRLAIENLLDDICKLELSQCALLKRRIIIVTLWFGTSLFMALFIPNITSAVNALGVVATLFIFVFPGMCLFKVGLKTEEWTNNKRYTIMTISLLFFSFGAFLFGLTLTQTIQYIIGLRPSIHGHTKKCII